MRSIGTSDIVRQAVRSQSMTFSMRDVNGFTPAEAAGLKRRIDDVTAGNASVHDLWQHIGNRRSEREELHRRLLI